MELQKLISRHMEPDSFSEYLVQNIYYDTANWDVIRASIEKPVYKEKMRLRCYNMPDKDSHVYLELKKKLMGVVYKRRINIPYGDLSCCSIEDAAAGNSQVARELYFYLKKNAVSQRIYISYRRTAFAGENIRVTFDSGARFRLERLDYAAPDDGEIILPQNKTLMEIKTPAAVPLWMARALCEKGIYPVSFSKYGESYKEYLRRQKSNA